MGAGGRDVVKLISLLFFPSVFYGGLLGGGEGQREIPCLFGFSFSIKEMALKIATKSPSVTKGLPDSLDKVFRRKSIS